MAEEPVFQAMKDIKKAFYTSNAETCIREAEKKFGAGKLVKSWFENRRYFYKNIERGKGHNAGVPAGTLLGVENFLLFMATNESVTGGNKKLLIISLYADDASPGALLSQLPVFQEALDQAKAWADLQGVSYHMDGKKGPQFLAYLKKGQKYPPEFDNIKLGDSVFVPAKCKQVDEGGEILVVDSDSVSQANADFFSAKLLGLLIKTRGKATKGTYFMDKYGYELEWPVSRVKSIAYRLQEVQNDVISERLGLMVNAYPAGVMRFCCCLKWLRAPIAQKDSLRFFYCMAIGATLGLNAAEIFNLRVCSREAISDSSEYYKNLIADTGFPTLYEMVKMDAYSLIIQWMEMEPFLFPVPPDRSALGRRLAARRKKKMVLPLSTSQPGLVSEVLDLALQHEDDIYSRSEELKKRRIMYKNRPHLINPSPPAALRLSRLRKLCEERQWSNIQFQRMVKFEAMLVYGCFEPKDRLEKFKEPVEFTEIQTEDDGWRIKTFKRKRVGTGELSREDVTPVRIELANKFAYLEGREETFSESKSFEQTLTPVGDKGSKEDECGTPKSKRSKGRHFPMTRAKKRLKNNAPKIIGAHFFGKPIEIIEFEPKKRKLNFNRDSTFKNFSLICKFCKEDTAFEKSHLLNCPGVDSTIKKRITPHKLKNAIQKCRFWCRNRYFRLNIFCAQFRFIFAAQIFFLLITGAQVLLWSIRKCVTVFLCCSVRRSTLQPIF